MKWRDPIDAELNTLQQQLADVDPDLSPAVARHMNARIAELHVARDRPVPEDVSAQVCRSVDYLVDHASTLKMYVLATAPLELDHAREAIAGIREHLEIILQHLPDAEPV